MNKSLLVFSALVCACASFAQTRIDLRTQGKSVDFGDAAFTRPMKTGSELPATCNRGDLFFLTTAAAGENIYGCSDANVWKLQAGAVTDCRPTMASANSIAQSACNFKPEGLPAISIVAGNYVTNSGMGTLYVCAGVLGLITYQSGTLSLSARPSGVANGGFTSTGCPVGTRELWNAAATINPGQFDPEGIIDSRFPLVTQARNTAGHGIILTDSNINGGQTISLDTAVAQTKIAAQAGQELICNGSADATAQTCTMSPVLTAYTPGMQIRWRNGAANSNGPITLNAGPGAVPIKSHNGTADPAANELVANAYYALTYDGSVFRLPSASGQASFVDTTGLLSKTAAQAGQELICSGSASSTAQTCTMSPALSSYVSGMRIRWRSGAANTNGALTLNAGPGPAPIKTFDGVTDPIASKLAANAFYDLTYDGSVFRLGAGIGLPSEIDPAVVQTKSAEQAGQEVVCNGSANATAQTCALTPALTSYTPGMRLRWRNGAANTSGAITLNAGPGVVAIKAHNGSANPAANELVANAYYDLTYDGSVFRLPASGQASQIDPAVVQTKIAEQAGQEVVCVGSASATAQTCAMTPALTTYTSGMRIRWRNGADNSNGAVTLNAGPGAKSIKAYDGVTDPIANDLAGNAFYDLTYDGTVFRLPPMGGGSGSTYTAGTGVTITGPSVSVDSAVVPCYLTGTGIPTTPYTGTWTGCTYIQSDSVPANTPFLCTAHSSSGCTAWTSLESQAVAQAGQNLLCNGSANSTAQTCSMTPALTAYVTGMRIRWKNGAANTSGALTLDAGAGAKAIKAFDGVANPTANELFANAYYDLTYDGTVFRLPATGSSGSGGGSGSIDTSSFLTKAGSQAGQELVCNGSANATTQSCAMTPAVTTYTTGMRIRWKSGATNTSGSIALDAGAGSRAIRKYDGVSNPTANELVANAYYDLTYDGTVFRLPMTSTSSTPVDTSSFVTKSGLQAGQEVVCNGSASATAQTCSMTPALTSYTAGMRIRWKSGAANTSGAITLDAGAGPKQITKHDGVTSPSANDLAANIFYDLTYDGTVFRLLPSGGTTYTAGAGITISGSSIAIDKTAIPCHVRAAGVPTTPYAGTWTGCLYVQTNSTPANAASICTDHTSSGCTGWSALGSSSSSGSSGSSLTGLARLKNTTEPIKDEFTYTENLGNGTIAGLRWTTSSTGSASASIRSEASTPGFLRIATANAGTNTSSNSVLFVKSGSTSSVTQQGFDVSGSGWYWSTRIRISDTSTSGASAYGGFIDNAANTSAQALYFFWSANGNVTFKACSTSCGATLNSGVAPTSGTWMTIDMWSTSAGVVNCAIDGVPVGTLSTNIPTVSLAPLLAGGLLGSQTWSTPLTVDYDYWGYIWEGTR